MTPIRIRLDRLMIWVGVVAFNLGIGVAAFRRNPELTFILALPVLMLQLAACQSVRKQGRSRAFWLGFVASKLCLLLHILVLMLANLENGIPGDWLWEYTELVSGVIVTVLAFAFEATENPWSLVGILSVSLFCLIWLVPFLLVSWLVALVSRWAYDRYKATRLIEPTPAQ